MQIEFKPRNGTDGIKNISSKHLIAWIVILLIVGSCIWKAIDTSPSFKNHHNHLCDTCEAKGHYSPATSFTEGKEWCGDCLSAYLNKAIIDSAYYSN